MAAKKKAAKAQKAAVKARYNPYVQRIVDDEDLRQNIVQAYESSRDAFGRLSNGKSPSKQIFDDKKLQKDLKEAAESIRDASVALREAPKKQRKRRLRPLLLLGLVGGGRRARRSPRACARRSSTRCSAPRRSSSTPRRPRRRPRRRRRRPAPRPSAARDAERFREGAHRAPFLTVWCGQPHPRMRDSLASRCSRRRRDSRMSLRTPAAARRRWRACWSPPPPHGRHQARLRRPAAQGRAARASRARRPSTTLLPAAASRSTAGDSLKFTIVGFHTSFRAQGRRGPPLAVAARQPSPAPRTPPARTSGSTASRRSRPTRGVIAPGRQDDRRQEGRRLGVALDGPAEAVDRAIPASGNYTLLCSIHPGMTLKVTSSKKGADVPTAKPGRAARRQAGQGRARSARQEARRASRAPRATRSRPAATTRASPAIAFYPAARPCRPASRHVHDAQALDRDPQRRVRPRGLPRRARARRSWPGLRAVRDLPSEPPGHADRPSTAPTTATASINTGVMDADAASPLPASAQITFTKPGTYRYFCTVHGNDMAGELTVTVMPPRLLIVSRSPSPSRSPRRWPRRRRRRQGARRSRSATSSYAPAKQTIKQGRQGALPAGPPSFDVHDVNVQVRPGEVPLAARRPPARGRTSSRRPGSTSSTARSTRTWA